MAKTKEQINKEAWSELMELAQDLNNYRDNALRNGDLSLTLKNADQYDLAAIQRIRKLIADESK